MPAFKHSLLHKLILSVSLLAVFAACMEKPKNGRGGDKAMFRVTSPIEAKAYKGQTDDNGVPKQISYELTACLNDVAKNEAVAASPFSIIEATSGRVIVSKRNTNNKGCLTWTQAVPFEFFAKGKYVTYPIIIQSNGRLRGEVSHTLAFNPWAALVKESKFPAFADLSLSSAPAGAEVVPVEKANEALMTRSTGYERARLYLEDVKVTISEDKYTTGGVKFKLVVTATPKVLLLDAGGETVPYTLERGDFHIEPTLLHIESGHTRDKYKQAERVPLHPPMKPQLTRILPSRGLVLETSIPSPYYKKQGEIWLALKVDFEGMSLESANAKNHPSLLLNQYEALYYLMDARDPLKSAPGILIADSAGTMNDTRVEQRLKNNKGLSSKEREALESQLDILNLNEFIAKSEGHDGLMKKAAEARKSKPYNPAFKGWALTRYEIPPSDRVPFVEIVKDDPKKKQTVLEKTISLQMKICFNGFFARNPLAYHEIDVTDIHGNPVIPKPITGSDGCIGWIEHLTFPPYDVQHFMFETVHVKNEELGIDQEIPLALNPWDPGWTSGRDIRPIKGCNGDEELVKGFNRLSHATLECVKRQYVKDYCESNKAKMIIEKDNKGDMRMSCVDEKVLADHRANIFGPSARLQDMKPSIFLSGYTLAFKATKYFISAIQELLGLEVYRYYVLTIKPQIVRHDSITQGLEADPQQAPDGFYYLRLVLQRNLEEETPQLSGHAKEVDEDVQIKNVPGACRATDGGIVPDDRPDKGYIAHWEGVVRVNGHTLQVPMKLSFKEMYLLGSRNNLLVQMVPLVENDKNFPPGSEQQNVEFEINDVNQSVVTKEFPTTEYLVGPTYRSYLVLGGPDEHVTGDLYANCQSAKEVIAARAGIDNEVKLDNLTKFGKEEPTDRQLADKGLNDFLEDLKQQFGMAVKYLPFRDKSDEIQKITDGMNAIRRQAIDPEDKNDEANFYASQLSEIFGTGPLMLSNIKHSVQDWKYIVNFYFGPTNSPGNQPSMLDNPPPLPRWPEAIQSPDPREAANQTLRQYKALRHFMMRKLCMYWASGKIYEDLLGKKSPFFNDIVLRTHRTMTQAYYPRYELNHNWIYDHNRENTDICKDPDQVFRIDKRVRILQLDKARSKFTGGQSENYQVSMNLQYNHGINASTQTQESDALSVKYFAARWPSKLAEPFGGFINLLGPDLQRTHTWTSSKSVSVDMTRQRSSQNSKSVYLVIHKTDINLRAKLFDMCLYISPNEEFFKHKNWLPNVSKEQRLEYMKFGILICNGEEVKGPIVLPESYYYIAQHFTPGPILDSAYRDNRPWLMLIRGTRDFVEFISQIEDPKIRDELKKDPSLRTTTMILSSPYRRRLTQIADNRYPTFDGLYSIFEDPYYGDEDFAALKRHAEREDCIGSLSEYTAYAMKHPFKALDHIVHAPFKFKNLDCTVQEADKIK